MSISHKDCCVLNSGGGAWAFETLAAQLSVSLGVAVSQQPRQFNYLLNIEDPERPLDFEVFIPIQSVRLASDKRALTTVFRQGNVPTPNTQLFDTYDEVLEFVRQHSEREWCLKYPTSCGGTGHRLLTESDAEPANWPRPFVVQEFIRLEHPEVYRTYCAGGQLFGWVARRFPKGTRPSPWVAHARGAQYVCLSDAPPQALDVARRALVATGLYDSFGCVDLLRNPAGEWLALEVGTDGIANHVDRDLGVPEFEKDLSQRIADAFWKSAQRLDKSANS